jgi:hypothetical protein
MPWCGAVQCRPAANSFPFPALPDEVCDDGRGHNIEILGGPWSFPVRSSLLVLLVKPPTDTRAPAPLDAWARTGWVGRAGRASEKQARMGCCSVGGWWSVVWPRSVQVGAGGVCLCLPGREDAPVPFDDGARPQAGWRARWASPHAAGNCLAARQPEGGKQPGRRMRKGRARSMVRDRSG